MLENCTGFVGPFIFPLVFLLRIRTETITIFSGNHRVKTFLGTPQGFASAQNSHPNRVLQSMSTHTFFLLLDGFHSYACGLLGLFNLVFFDLNYFSCNHHFWLLEVNQITGQITLDGEIMGS